MIAEAGFIQCGDFPHCGSTEPVGSYFFSNKAARRLRVEHAKDDETLLVNDAGVFAVAALWYGFLLGSSTFVRRSWPAPALGS